MHIAHLALSFASLALNVKGPAIANIVAEHVLPPTVKLARSPLLQAQTLQVSFLPGCVAKTSGLNNILTPSVPLPSFANHNTEYWV